jgi:hypothetical protein
MTTGQIMKIFGLSAFNDKELKSDEEILKMIESCKKLSDSMSCEYKILGREPGSSSC